MEEMRAELQSRNAPRVWYEYDAVNGKAMPEIAGFVFDDPETPYHLAPAPFDAPSPYEHAYVVAPDGAQLLAGEAYRHDVDVLTADELGKRACDFRSLIDVVKELRQDLPTLDSDVRNERVQEVLSHWQAMTFEDSRPEVGVKFELASSMVPELQDGLLDYIHAGCWAKFDEYNTEPLNARNLSSAEFGDSAMDAVYNMTSLFGPDGDKLSQHDKDIVAEFRGILKDACMERVYTNPPEDGIMRRDGLRPMDFGLVTANGVTDTGLPYVLDESKPGVRDFERNELASSCGRVDRGFGALDSKDLPRAVYDTFGGNAKVKGYYFDEPGKEYKVPVDSLTNKMDYTALELVAPDGSYTSGYQLFKSYAPDMSEEARVKRAEQFDILQSAAHEAREMLAKEQRAETRVHICEEVLSHWQAMTYGRQDAEVGIHFEKASANVLGLQDGLLEYIEAGCQAKKDFYNLEPMSVRNESGKAFGEAAMKSVYNMTEMFGPAGASLGDIERHYVESFRGSLKDACEEHVYTNPPEDGANKVARVGLSVSDFGVVSADGVYDAGLRGQLDITKPGVREFETNELANSCGRIDVAFEKPKSRSRDTRDLDAACADIEASGELSAGDEQVLY